MEAQQVVHVEAKSWDGSLEFESVVRSMPVVVVEEELETRGTLVGMGVSVGVGPLAEAGLDEALGLAIGLWGVGSGEAMLEAEDRSGRAHGLGGSRSRCRNRCAGL